MNKSKLLVLTLMVLVSLIVDLNGQKSNVVSLETQLYPTGIIPGISTDIGLSELSFLHLRVAANIFDHRDLGVQDKEEGSGYGFTLGYRKFISQENKNWRWGIKSDFWINEVDWQNELESGAIESGSTKISVLQPTGELAYVFDLNGFIIAPSFSFGVEWNINTDGRPTGEGLIVLLGVQIGKKF